MQVSSSKKAQQSRPERYKRFTMDFCARPRVLCALRGGGKCREEPPAPRALTPPHPTSPNPTCVVSNVLAERTHFRVINYSFLPWVLLLTILGAQAARDMVMMVPTIWGGGGEGGARAFPSFRPLPSPRKYLLQKFLTASVPVKGWVDL